MYGQTYTRISTDGQATLTRPVSFPYGYDRYEGTKTYVFFTPRFAIRKRVQTRSKSMICQIEKIQNKNIRVELWSKSGFTN